MSIVVERTKTRSYAEIEPAKDPELWIKEVVGGRLMVSIDTAHLMIRTDQGEGTCARMEGDGRATLYLTPEVATALMSGLCQWQSQRHAREDEPVRAAS